MKLALVQMEGKGTEQADSTYDRIISTCKQTCQTDADLILFPECAWPAYFIGYDSNAEQHALGRTKDLLLSLQQLAKTYAKYIVIGVCIEENGSLYNSAVVLSPEGKLLGRADKAYLWHFDSSWFSPGSHAFVFDTPFGRIGVMVCADGRIPEISRMLALQGARLILDLVNLVASAPVPAQLNNQQYEFMLAVRARENNVYIAVSNKWGVERNMITFLGRSIVLKPDGSTLLEMGPEEDGAAVCEIDFTAEFPIPQRRPNLYQMLGHPTASLPVYEKMQLAVSPDQMEYYTCMVRFSCKSAEEYIEKAKSYIQGCILMGARLIILPQLNQEFSWKKEYDHRIQSCLSGPTVAVLSFFTEIQKQLIPTARIYQGSTAPVQITASHLSPLVQNIQITTADLSPTCSLGFVFQEEMEIPEISRAVMLMGADILIWYDSTGETEMTLKYMQTRSAENKIYTIRHSSCSNIDRCMMVSPDGRPVCSTFISAEHTAAGMIYTGFSRAKNLIPGTNIVTDRKPEMYGLML